MAMFEVSNLQVNVQVLERSSQPLKRFGIVEPILAPTVPNIFSRGWQAGSATLATQRSVKALVE